MERRQILKCLLAGGVSATLGAPVLAQQGAPRPQSSPPRVAAAGDGASRPEGTTVLTTPAELEAVLREWEQKTSIIENLRGTHQRYEYDAVFGIEKRAVGEFWHEAPDKGRIDFKPPDELPNPPINAGKLTASGQPYTIQAEEPQTWVCDGKSIMQVDHTSKTYGLAEIPPQHQGQNIMDGPLPFLFGMKADRIKQRYQLSLGSKHNKTGSDGRKKYHIVARPLLQDDARNWQRAEVILDAEFCLPTAIRLIDPSGNKETVYVFPLGELDGNKKWFKDPFKMSLRGYKITQKQVATPPAQPQGTEVLPASGSEPLGRATLRDAPARTN